MSWPIERDPWFGCELWAGTLNSNGYGTFWDHGRARLAHYVAWERAGYVVAAGKVLDHLCRRRRCTLVAHLEAVSQAENNRRRAWAHRAGRQRCARGHDLWVHGRRTPEAGTICRVCSGVWQQPTKDPELE